MKIEKEKELLEYGEMNLGEITNHLGYKTLRHLSGQFRTTRENQQDSIKLKSKYRKGLGKI